MESSPSELPNLSQLSSYFLGTCFTLASMVVLILEYIQTVEQEAKLIWPTKWSAVKVIFILNRYLPLVFVPPVAYFNVTLITPTLMCKSLFTVFAVGIAGSVITADALLYIRIYAVSGRSQTVRNILIANALCVLGLTLGPWGVYVFKTTFVQPPFHRRGCFAVEPGPSLLVMLAFGSLLYSTILTASLFVFYAARLNRASSRVNPLLKVLYIDGAMYFIFIAAFSIVNGLVSVLSPERVPYRFIVVIPQAISHNILAARMVLHIRQAARTDMGFQSSGGSKRMTIIEFKAASEPPRSTSESGLAAGEEAQSNQSNSIGSGIHIDPGSLDGRTWGTKAQWHGV
ncbi:hypothetical protein FA15DRAFT_759312 [Coprinopsis marcescibilis]|uniref:DUF6533 domain-containing protein n=1 Tax=Coprinopsis marcescibilis TaxID=230819 RepID=A0A5C3KKV7_COPMA|nr:hypothetical protein FA15DRAFT_759312 [Coprinopsis marcescibilis]